MRRRKNHYRSLLGLAFFLLFSCTAGEDVKLRIELPRKAPVDLGLYTAVILTDFIVKTAPEGLDVNKEWQEYFLEELKQKMEKEVRSQSISYPGEEVLKEPDFWRKQFQGSKGSLLVAGTLDYMAEVRKIIKPKKKRRFETPFPEESRITQRKFYSLKMDFHLIDAQTGKTIYTRTFNESKSYKNPNQTADFAFYDLMIVVKDKLFRDLLGEPLAQERYLIK
ncbi:MAG: hypothetical protein ACE5L7_10910 [Candidatus Aminicenantales bacterium]